MSDTDPYLEREKLKYENPIPSREFILQLLEKSSKPLTIEQLAASLSIQEKEQLVALQRRMGAMERDAQVVVNRSGRYGLPDKMELIRGTVIGHKDGFGFLQIHGEKNAKDLYIHQSQMNALLHGDEVLAKVDGSAVKGRQEAKIVRVLHTRKELIVGRYFVEQGLAFVVPDDQRICQDIIVDQKDNKGARQGHIVVVKITQRPSKRINAMGMITEVLGEKMDPGMEIQVALRNHDIPHQWSETVKRYIKKFGKDVPEQAKQNRIDLRELPLVTIDGEDARDFDDAVFCEADEKGGWRLWVAIADVSYYVKKGTSLDEEAKERATSVYFPEQVIAMLPEVLSNGLCSLNPQVDRLCMVCEMQISSSGKLEQYTFYEAVMRSHARLTYTKVAKILNGDPKLRKQYDPLVGHLETLHSLYKTLASARKNRGAIEFETEEVRFIFNAHRKIEQIVPLVRNDAHKVIEECMILANVSAAKFLEADQTPGLYRVHETPDPSRLETFTGYLAELGVEHKIKDDAAPSDFSEVIKKIADRPDKELIQTMLLRSMRQAVYQADNLGHFGLALAQYAHFTSPIRRYPDLVVHRAIKAQVAKLAGTKSKSGGYAYDHDEVDQIGEHCSVCERRADDAVREVTDWLKCEFMRDHVGNEYQGVVASVTSFGLFVRIKDMHIDGLVHISSLQSDYYHYDEVKQRLVGEATGKAYRLGDELEVKVAAVNLDERKIDFMLAGDNASENKQTPRKAKPAAKKSSRKGAPKKQHISPQTDNAEEMSVREQLMMGMIPTKKSSPNKKSSATSKKSPSSTKKTANKAKSTAKPKSRKRKK